MVREPQKLIYKNAKEIFLEQDKALFLGGDHSISYSLVKAFKDVNGIDSFLVVFDAHADCMDSRGMKEPTHEEWLRALIEQGFSVENIILISTRFLISIPNGI